MNRAALTVELGDGWAWWGPGIGRASAPFEGDAEDVQSEPRLPEPLAEQLERDGTPAHVQLRVAADRARLLMLPHADALYSESRWRQFARGRFEQVFGVTADDWRLQWLAEPPGCPRLLAALPERWVSSLARQFGRRLRSLQVDALARLERLRHEQPRFNGALLDLGANHALLLLLAQGRPRRVRLRRGAPVLDELRAMLTTEWAALAAEQGGLPASLPHLAVGPAAAIDAADWDALATLAPRLHRVEA